MDRCVKLRDQLRVRFFDLFDQFDILLHLLEERHGYDGPVEDDWVKGCYLTLFCGRKRGGGHGFYLRCCSDCFFRKSKKDRPCPDQNASQPGALTSFRLNWFAVQAYEALFFLLAAFVVGGFPAVGTILE